MFTGLVQTITTMTDVHRELPGVRLVFLAHHLVDTIKAGYIKVGIASPSTAVALRWWPSTPTAFF